MSKATHSRNWEGLEVVHAGALDEQVAGGQGSRSGATTLLPHLFAPVHAHDFSTDGGGTERSSKP